MSLQSCALAVALVLNVLWGAFGIVELIYGATYQDSYTCDSSPVVEPPTWLITSGSVLLGTAFFGVMYSLYFLCGGSGGTDCAAVFRLFSMTLFGLVGLFHVAWAVVGGVMLWRDCRGETPDNLRVFTWIAVITHCVVAFYALERLNSSNTSRSSSSASFA